MADIPFVQSMGMGMGMTVLEAQITIVVPSTQGIRRQRSLSKAEMENRVDGVRKYLAKLFGGYTSVNATGGYVMKSGKLVHENVVNVTSFGEKAIALRNRGTLVRKLKRWCIEFQQESMGLIWETDLIIIGRK